MKDTQTLMHKGDKVIDCKFDSRGYLKAITRVYDEKLLPVGIDLCKEGDIPKLDLQKWILSRGLALNRKDIASLRDFYGNEVFQMHSAVSLFDCYWFADSKTKDWEEINPYTQWDCKTDSIFLMLSMHPEEVKEYNYHSPNLTIPGRMPRLWYTGEKGNLLLHGDAQGQMALYKNGKDNPLIAKREYKILYGQVYATTLAETNQDVELISFEDIYNSCQDPEKSKSYNIKMCCEKYGIPNWIDFFEKMAAFDEKIGNDSRELCDIGVLRDANTLEMIKFAKL